MGRVIEISDPLVSLSLNRGFMKVQVDKIDKSQIALSDIDILILNGSGASLTTNLLNELLENLSSVIILGKNYSPNGIFYPTNPHYLHKHKINLQINASKPLNKRLWQAIVKAKILNQAKILSFFSNDEEKQLLELAKKVNSGDPENIEAQAAKKYWRKLFGEDFRRDYSSIGINSLLNYGYAILRASTARAVFSCGLNPSIGVHHNNMENAFCLIDDLIEPYRPIVDFVVKRISENNKNLTELDKDHKKNLTKILEIKISMNDENMILPNSIIKFCQSFVNSLEQNAEKLEFPLSPLPIEFEIF